MARRGDGKVIWQHALDYVAKLNTENYLGHNDWRLPNVSELNSLVNTEMADLHTWLNTQGFLNVQSNYYWSSSTIAFNTANAWYVSMGSGYMDGTVDQAGKYGSLFVWPVRGGQSGHFDSLALSKTGQTTSYSARDDGALQSGTPWPAPRFTDNSDLTLTDNLTGLVWSKDANPDAVGKSWQSALDYIKLLNSSNYLGYNDWRLPNRNELSSLINYGE